MQQVLSLPSSSLLRTQAKEPIDSYDFVVIEGKNKLFLAPVQSAGAKKCVDTPWVRQCIIEEALQPVPSWDWRNFRVNERLGRSIERCLR